MDIKKKTKLREDQLELTLEKLFYDKRFIEEIKQIRLKVGIPSKGYTKFEDYFNFLSEGRGDSFSMHMKLESELMRLSKNKNLPVHYAHWLEAFLVLGYKWKNFESRLPFHRQREFSIHGLTCALDTHEHTDDRINLSIFSGATQKSIKDFIDQHWNTIEASLNKRVSHGAVPSTRKSKRDYAEIFERAKKGQFNSLGEWLPGKDGEPRPPCIKDIGPARIVEIINQRKTRAELEK